MPGYWESCYLLRKGVQLLGENCFPPWEGGEQWLVWEDSLGPDLPGWVDCLLPDCYLGGGPVPSGRS